MAASNLGVRLTPKADIEWLSHVPLVPEADILTKHVVRDLRVEYPTTKKPRAMSRGFVNYSIRQQLELSASCFGQSKRVKVYGCIDIVERRSARGTPHQQMSIAKSASLHNVRFGSKADMCSAQVDVRYVPKADIAHADDPMWVSAWLFYQ